MVANVSKCLFDSDFVISKLAKATITCSAEQLTHTITARRISLAASVVVVYLKSAARLQANSTSATLCYNHFAILSKCYFVLAAKLAVLKNIWISPCPSPIAVSNCFGVALGVALARGLTARPTRTVGVPVNHTTSLTWLIG
jgi:hypothetical protein